MGKRFVQLAIKKPYMRQLSKAALSLLFVFSVALAASAQDPNPNFSKELHQEMPHLQK